LINHLGILCGVNCPLGSTIFPSRFLFTLLISNIVCTYETLCNKMARLIAECVAQWIQHICCLGVGVGAGMGCHQLL
jgi:hypothetical protein